MKSFKDVPVEDDTKIIFQEETKLDEYDILYQKWFWEGIAAESIIFINEDVMELSDEEIEMKVKTSPLFKLGSSTTMKRLESGFTFVNFNFEVK